MSNKPILIENFMSFTANHPEAFIRQAVDKLKVTPVCEGISYTIIERISAKRGVKYNREEVAKRMNDLNKQSPIKFGFKSYWSSGFLLCVDKDNHVQIKNAQT